MKEKRARRKWSPARKQEIADNVQRQLKAGMPFARISRELDIHTGTLRLWMRQFPSAELLPVKIEQAERDVANNILGNEAGGSISLCVPGGFRFEGLDVGDVAVLLEELR